LEDIKADPVINSDFRSLGMQGEHVSKNVQMIDINPTILDYIGVDKPAFMYGQSLLRSI